MLNNSGEPRLNTWGFTDEGSEGRSSNYSGGAFFVPVTYRSVDLQEGFGQLARRFGIHPRPSLRGN